ncbi:MAG: DUF5686 and carboxypeptidase regulatory-like domain-containing protein [Muribaculaceae bacterium]|nr:DUF5686 and carboxypeptidase regulatory-like domain-containing protein [Muribaculaceae bacterium]
MSQRYEILRNLLTFILLISWIPFFANAESRIEVVDSVTGEPVPYVSVTVKGFRHGYLTNEKGQIDIALPRSADTLRLDLSVLGYDRKSVSIPASERRAVIKMSGTGIKLKEVEVRNKRDRYSKKDNPAVAFARKVRQGDSITDPRRNSNYNYNRFERIVLGLNKFETDTSGKALKKKFGFLREYVDTSEVSGEPVLILSVKEKLSEIHYRKSPESEKIYVTGIRQEGVDDFIDQKSMQTFLEDVLREVDLYDNDINILQNRFVSPLSRIAPDFYKFFLTDTVEIEGERCVELSFTPHNRAMFGFTGHIYVPQGDTTMFVKRVEMRLPPGANVNFIDNLYLSQEYIRGSDGSRLKTNDDMTVEMSVIPGMQGLYVRRNTRYDSHDFNPSGRPELFGMLGQEIIADGAYRRDSVFWKENTTIAPTGNERRVSELVSRMRSVKLYYWGEKFIKYLSVGYVGTSPHNSKFDIGPLNSFISGNDVEGLRLRFGGMTTANLSPNWFSRGYVAYGTKDHKFKYKGELEYSFIKKDYHSREFPVHSIMVSHLFDVDQIGQHYIFTNMDNVFLSLKRMKNTLITYHRVSELKYTLELRNNFSVAASVQHHRQEATPFVPFTNGYGATFNHYDMIYGTLELRYAPGEKFYQNRTNRFPINLDAPVFILTHTYGPDRSGGTRFGINKTELSVQKRFWFSTFGYTDVILKGGHLWGGTPFPQLFTPNANLSYTIQPESFALLNPLEFVADSYCSWDVTYWANGAIFNYIPVLKRLKLREVFCFRGYTGELSQVNNPDYSPWLLEFPVQCHTTGMNWKPYMELSAGIDNLFRCLRVDYVWRMSYLDRPDIDKSGLRIALHFTF